MTFPEQFQGVKKGKRYEDMRTIDLATYLRNWRENIITSEQELETKYFSLKIEGSIQ